MDNPGNRMPNPTGNMGEYPVPQFRAPEMVLPAKFAIGGLAAPVHADTGGAITSPTQQSAHVDDSVDAKLSGGEYVFPASAVQWHGLKTLTDLRASADKGMADLHAVGQIKGPGVPAPAPQNGLGAPAQPGQPPAAPGPQSAPQAPATGLGGPQGFGPGQQPAPGMPNGQGASTPVQSPPPTMPQSKPGFATGGLVSPTDFFAATRDSTYDNPGAAAQASAGPRDGAPGGAPTKDGTMGFGQETLSSIENALDSTGRATQGMIGQGPLGAQIGGQIGGMLGPVGGMVGRGLGSAITEGIEASKQNDMATANGLPGIDFGDYLSSVAHDVFGSWAGTPQVDTLGKQVAAEQLKGNPQFGPLNNAAPPEAAPDPGSAPEAAQSGGNGDASSDGNPDHGDRDAAFASGGLVAPQLPKKNRKTPIGTVYQRSGNSGLAAPQLNMAG